MASYFHGDTRKYEKRPREFAWMWMNSHIEGFLRWYSRVNLREIPVKIPGMELGGQVLVEQYVIVQYLEA